jgi:hypothetical protein
MPSGPHSRQPLAEPKKTSKQVEAASVGGLFHFCKSFKMSSYLARTAACMKSCAARQQWHLGLQTAFGRLAI